MNTTGGNILDKNPLATDIPNEPSIQTSWVQHIVSKFGNSAQSGIIYQMDNEVSNWAYMHRDVHPQPVTYAEIVNQTSVRFLLFCHFLLTTIIDIRRSCEKS